MSLTLIPLGTNGFFPSGGRHTMSFLLLGGTAPILIDAGTGVSRLLQPELARRLAGHTEIHLLLTHYHLDHVVGLSYLPAICRDYRLVIHAPEPPLVDGDPSALNRLISPPLFPVELADLVSEVVVNSYSADLKVAGLPVRVLRQQHAGGSVGLVIGGDLAFLTDCEANGASASFARGARVLVHEVWLTDEEASGGTPRHGHSIVREVARVARESEVEVLVPVHHRPGRNSAELGKMAERLADASGVALQPAIEGVPISI